MEKEITIYDIAKKLNLSAATISRALKDHPAINRNTKKKILETAESMGYRSNTFASNLRRRKTNTLGVLVPRLNSNFMSIVLSAMEKTAAEAGYHILISQSNESADKEKENAHLMYINRVDGLLASLSYDTQNIQHFKKFTEKGIPIVFFDRVFDDDQIISVVIDNFKNGFDLTEHLIQQGCKRIMHVTGSLKRNNYLHRLEGYQQALSQYQIPFFEELVISGEMTEEFGASIADHIQQLPKNKQPDAVFVANDVCAASLMRQLQINGWKVPQDIAIAGFNNDPISRLMEPNITTIHYPAAEMGAIAIQQMIQHLSGKTNLLATNRIILRSELLIRDSTLRKK